MTSDEDQKTLDTVHDGGRKSPAVPDKGGPLSVEIKNLIVAPLAQRQLALGDSESLVAAARDLNLEAIVWNEHRIVLLTDDASREITYEPEIHDHAAMFFLRDEKRKNAGFGEQGPRIWEGDFQPVQFSKRSLLKFMREHAVLFPQNVQDAVRQMKVTTSKVEETEMLDVDSDDERRVEEEREVTNVPKKFSARIPIAEGVQAELNFEAKLGVLLDRYDNPTNKRCIELRCTNARQVLRELMQGLVAGLPEGVPRYYGAARTLRGGRDG